MDHADLAPSAAPQWVYCAGSVKAQKQHPQGDTDDTREGEASHWVCSEVLLSFKTSPISAKSFIGKTAPNGVIIDEEMVEAADEYIFIVLKTAQKYGLMKALRIEERVKIDRVHKDNWGTTDTRAFDSTSNTLFIFDYKYGHRYVDVYENWQLVDYGIGAIDEITNVSDLDITVVFVIVQPRCFHGEGPVTQWVVNAADLRAQANILKAAAEAALGDNPTMTTGNHCLDCSANHVCDGAAKAAGAAMDIARAPLSLTEHTSHSISVELSMLKRAETALKARITGLEAEVESKILKGVLIPGWTVRNGKGRKKWNKSTAEVLALGAMFKKNLGKDALITPTQAIKLGIDESVINNYSVVPSTSFKLVKDDGSKARQVFTQKRI